jgi:hypothetical protein
MGNITSTNRTVGLGIRNNSEVPRGNRLSYLRLSQRQPRSLRYELTTVKRLMMH